MTHAEFESRYVNQIICGDCLEVMKDWPDKCVDLVLTDPPYNIGYTYDSYADSLTEEAYVELLAQFQYPYKTVIIHYPEETIQYVAPALGVPEEILTWCYHSNLPRQSRLISFFNCRPDLTRVLQPYKNPDDKRIQSLLATGRSGRPLYDWFDDIQIVKNVSKGYNQHPCPVPLVLMERLVLLTSNAMDLILDPFCGSGTTCVAAKKLGRRYIGIDISEKYCETARMRLKEVETGVTVAEQKKGQMGLFQ